MYYYKRPDGEVTEYSYKDDYVLQFGYEEITKEEYDAKVEEIMSQEPVNEQPTYEELEEENARLLYQLLTGEEYE